MNAWLLGGLGAGFVIGWMTRQLKLKQSPAVPPARQVARQQALQEQDLQQTQLAYSMAKEMSQFKGGFLGRTSHELRSPLSAVISMHQLILADLCESPEEERDFIAQANAAALKMVKVLDEIIDVARVEHGISQISMDPIQLAQILQDVYTLTHLQAQNRNYPLQMPLPDPELLVLADARRLRQGLVSLINAAILGMTSGAIALTVQPITPDNRVHLWLDTPTSPDYWGDPLSLASLASKSGFPASDHPLSEQAIAYQTIQQLTQTAFPSAGFTLLLVYLILASMQGNLSLIPISAPDGTQEQTTRFQITLPIAALHEMP